VAILVIENYKNRAVKAAIFVVLGYGLSQVIRLAGNLVLTRLLVPEFFGIMALAHVFHRGLALFSDIGLEPGIIRSNRSNEPIFLNSAWTLQVIRGFILFGFSVVIAFPVAKIYQEPILIYVIPVIGLISIFDGFKATTLVVLSKELRQGKLTYIELTIQSIGLVIMIIIAYLYRNVWALVVGNLIASLFKTIWSHILPSKMHNSFKIEKDAVKELLSFGKWIFVSTAMMFLATQADRLLLGKLFPLSLFGIYSIAALFSELPKKIITAVSQKVIFPFISKFSYLPRKDLRSKISESRKLMLITSAVLVALFTCFGDFIILFLYDDRYVQAAWMLPILAIGIWPLILYATIDRSLYAIGKPGYSALGNLVKFIHMILLIPLLYYFMGILGAVVAVALNDIPVYIIINYGLWKEKLSLLRQDAFATFVLVVILIIILGLRLVFDMGVPGKIIFGS